MTGDNRRENIALERQRWEGSLRSARHLVSLGEFPDSVARAYYAMLHAARAVLLVRGLEARTHEGVSHLLYANFVRSGEMPAEVARELRRQQVEREDADYDRAVVVTQSMAEESLARAERFCQACLDLIVAAGMGQRAPAARGMADPAGECSGPQSKEPGVI